MRLLKLELFGFKSFADKTTILFDQGVTCIVGPNGCGKSNISDSIRWVLGERSAKLLRGSSMEDVIFAGTEFRKPLALAEVSITIDNTDRGLPIDYNEVTLTRRLYRSGESEYLINKTLCRLRDIQDLILDTGIGSNSYSMIEQGRIDYILNADADERRFLIEEAAGISKYKTKKDEAIRKLERTEENRLRLNDIVQEVHKNIQYAERQAKRAQKYQEQFERLKNLETRRAFYDLAELAQKKSQMEAEQTGIKTELSQLETQLAELQENQAKFNDVLRGVLDSYSGEEAKRYEIQLKMEQNAQRLQFHQEKRVEMASRLGQIQQEVKQLDERIHKNQDDRAAKAGEIRGVESDRSGAAAIAADIAGRLAGFTQRIDEIKSWINRSKAESFQAASMAAEIRNEYHRVNAFLSGSEERKKRLEAGLERLQNEVNDWERKHHHSAHESVRLDEELGTLAEQRSALDGRVENLHAEAERRQMELAAFQKSLHEKQARLDMIRQMESQAYQDEESILADCPDLNRGLTQSLRSIFTVQEGFEWALDAALEYFSKSIIAEDIQTAQALLKRFQEKRPLAMGILIRGLGSAKKYFTENREKPSHPSIVSALSDAVRIQSGFENLFHPFLDRVFIFEAPHPEKLIEELLPLAWGSKLICKEGITLGPDGRIFYRNHPLASEGGHYQRLAEQEKVEAEIHVLHQSIAECQAALETGKRELKDALQQKEEMDNLRMDTNIRKESFSAQTHSVEERLTSLGREIALQQLEIQEMVQEAETAQRQKSQLETELPIAQAAEEAIRSQQDAWGREIEELERERGSIFQLSAEHQAAVKTLDDRKRHLEAAISLLEDLCRQDSARIQELEKETVLIQQRESGLRTEDETLTADQSRLEALRHQCEVSLEFIRREKSAAEDEVARLNTAHQEIQTRVQVLQQSSHQHEMQSMELGYQEKTIHERLLQTYRIRLTDLNPQDYPLDQPLETLDEELAKLREKVESIGTVNLLAIEEYEELKKRYDFLLAQQKDLEDARESLMETIRTINRTTKTLFEETFTNVQKTFQEYYETLFRGGHARLVLIDESNPLESGIDIVVRPPGKKLQHISLLSGGEKALTAIALLFALFKIKPSPFCVLDEVDAPLDEANVDRFVTVLQTFLANSQFIIVTHNRKTIAMGSSLYGVTMEEPGVSKLVSVKVSEDAVKQGSLPPQSGKENASSIEEQINA